MRYRDDIYTIALGLGLVIYGVSQVVFKAVDKRSQTKFRRMMMRPVATAVPEKER